MSLRKALDVTRDVQSELWSNAGLGLVVTVDRLMLVEWLRKMADQIPSDSDNATPSEARILYEAAEELESEIRAAAEGGSE